MSEVCCFTSFTFSYLSRALILVQTLREAHPNWEIWAVLVDEPPNKEVLSDLEAFDHVVFAKELSFQRFDAWLFKHDIVEACTAVKGQMLEFLLDRGAKKVVYLDPDIAVFHPLSTITEALEIYSIVLTPHQVEPNDTEGFIKDNEMTAMKYGIYNLGFVAVRNDPYGRRFSKWWAERLYTACYDDVPNGIFTDQKWCDLVPALFANVLVHRDPGCNVASWNISKRHLAFDRDGALLVNGSPLKFYHFTKINSEGDVMTEKYSRENVEVMEVWNWYKRMLSTITIAKIPDRYWHYGAFSNGIKIPRSVRLLFRSRSDLFEYFDEPYKVDGNSFYEWLAREEPKLLALD